MNMKDKRPVNLKPYCIILMLFLFMPILQMLTKAIDPVNLNGIEPVTKYEHLSKASFASGKYQKAIERYLVKSNSLWSYALTLGNQFYHDFFQQISPNLNNSVLVGNDGYFFQSMYLGSFNRRKPIDIPRSDILIARLKEFDEYLKSRGITLVLLVSPNLINVYPEYLPKSYVDPTRLERQNTYDYFTPRLTESNLNFIDSFKIIKDLADKEDSPRYFQPTGSHLNDLGACIQVNEIMKVIEKTKNQRAEYLDCSNYVMKYPPLTKDIDLVDIANLAFPESTYVPSPELMEQKVGFSDDYKPSMLLVGSSFLFGVQEQLERFEIAKRSTLLFYNRNVRESSSQKMKGKPRKNNWIEKLSDYDVVLLEVNLSSLGRMGYGFSKEVLTQAKPK